jgi:hypothetical protein
VVEDGQCISALTSFVRGRASFKLDTSAHARISPKSETL